MVGELHLEETRGYEDVSLAPFSGVPQAMLVVSSAMARAVFLASMLGSSSGNQIMTGWPVRHSD
jgi:hypothetical protein